MKLKRWEIAIFIAVSVLVISGFKINSDAENLSEKLIRLHVVANSDSETDQALKLKVRDTVLETIEPLLDEKFSRDEAENIINEHMEEILLNAERTISENGFSYTVQGKITEENFPTIDYDTFSLPAGNYKALRIIIGEGKGHNWWCVVFPSLCTSAMLEYDKESMLTDAETALITKENGGYVIKFKIAEIIGELKNYFFK